MAYPDRCAVVIGGHGFVGKRLVEFLVARGGYKYIEVFDMHTPSDSEKISNNKAGTNLIYANSSMDTEPNILKEGTDTLSVNYYSGDLGHLEDLREFFKGCTRHGLPMVVFHLATPNPVSQNVELFEVVNVIGTKNLLEISKQMGVVGFVYCSTASVVFTNQPLVGATEELPIPAQSLDPYSATKAQAEKLVLEANSNSFRTLAIRPHMIFGNGDMGLIKGMVDSMKSGRNKFIISTDVVLVTPTHVDNVCWGHILAAEKLLTNTKVTGQAFNITNDREVGFWAFFSFFCGELGYERPRYRLPYCIASTFASLFSLFLGPTSIFTPMKVRLAGLSHSYSCEKAKQLLGYSPVIGLHAAMKNTVAYLKKSDKQLMQRYTETKALYRDSKAKFKNSLETDLRFVLIYWTLFYLSLGVLGYSIYRNLLSISYIVKFISKGQSPFSDPYGLFTPSLIADGLPWFYVTLGTSLLSFILHMFVTQSSVFGMNSKIPIVGGFLQILNGPTIPCTKLARQNFDCYSLQFFGKPVIFMTGQDGHEFFFKATDDEISLKEVYKVSMALFGRRVLYDVDVDSRQQQFHHLSQGFAEKNMIHYPALMLEECEQMFSSWPQQGECVDIGLLLAELITFTAARCLLGKEIRARYRVDCQHHLLTMDKGVTPLAMGFPFFPLPSHIQRDKSREALKKLFREVMEQRRARGEQTESDMLATLMNARYKDGSPFTDDQIAGCLLALIFGGQHTSSVTVTWTIINILKRTPPDYINKIIDEQKQVMENGGLTYQNIMHNMNVLSACITESLRLSNPLGVVLRYVVKSRSFKGYTFQPGSILGICSNEAGNNPDIFDGADQFWPHRWLENDWDEWRQEYKFIGFGAGRHTCMGRRFAHLQLKTIMSYIFQKFIITSNDEVPGRADEMVVGPDRPFKLQFSRYNGNLDDLRKQWKLAQRA